MQCVLDCQWPNLTLQSQGISLVGGGQDVVLIVSFHAPASTPRFQNALTRLLPCLSTSIGLPPILVPLTCEGVRLGPGADPFCASGPLERRKSAISFVE